MLEVAFSSMVQYALTTISSIFTFVFDNVFLRSMIMISVIMAAVFALYYRLHINKFQYNSKIIIGF